MRHAIAVALIVIAALLIGVSIFFFLNDNWPITSARNTKEINAILMCADGRNNSYFPWALCETDQWPFVSNNIDLVKIYIGDLGEDTNYEEVHCFVEAMKNKNIKIAVEIGGLLDWHAEKGNLAAHYSFEQEYKQLKPLLEIIDQLDYKLELIEFDCPVRRMLFPFDQKEEYHTAESAVAELVKLIELWNQVLPDTKLNMITNFPVWGWRGSPAYFSVDGYTDGYGQYNQILIEINKQLTAAGLKLNALTIDNPYDYITGSAETNQTELIATINWLSRLIDLENTARSYGLQVNVIFNSEIGGRSSNQLFMLHSLSYIDLYRESGGNPDGYWIQSWYEHPDRWLPEDEIYTITNLTGEVIKRIVQ